MALGQIDFRWRPSQVTIDPNVHKEMPTALGTIANSIAGARQSQYQKEQDRLARERQATLDARNEEDRQRRIAEEDRQKAAWATLGDAILGTAGVDVQALQDEKARLLAELQELGG